MTTSEQREFTREVAIAENLPDGVVYLADDSFGTRTTMSSEARLEVLGYIAQLRAQLAAAERERDALAKFAALQDAWELEAMGDITALFKERNELRTRAERAEANERRYQWLKERLFGANFEYELDEEDTMSALIFMLPEGAAVSANLDATIDALATTRDGQGAG